MSGFGSCDDLARFVAAQEPVYAEALAELHAGDKRSHWMWFVFPQLAGLGRSSMAERYGIRSLDEARAYIHHPLLGPRLRECVAALLSWHGRRDVAAILGTIDALKLRSSLTLFELAADDGLFGQALDALFGDERDALTLELLAPAELAG